MSNKRLIEVLEERMLNKRLLFLAPGAVAMGALAAERVAVVVASESMVGAHI